MDFLKTLLLYMTVTFAMTVQQAPAPGVAPETTAVPEYVEAQSIGTATPKPVLTATPVVTVTPKPAAPTRSAPTITPNTRYKTLQLGDRGSDVQKLQRRLIALGYLAKGQDDSAYGYQTRTAVLNFQKANGLSADGAAGRVTLTCLYEDPNVVSNPAAATATPTASPTPTTAPVPTTAAPAAETAAAATPAPAAEPTAVPLQTEIAPNISAQWTPMENAHVLLNGRELILLQQTSEGRAQHKVRVWMRDGSPVVSLDDLMAAAGSWQLMQADINRAQLLIAGYQVVLNAVSDTANGTCQAYTAMVNGTPIALNDGDIVCSRNQWYIAPTFITQIAKDARADWDAAEATLIISVKDASIANSID